MRFPPCSHSRKIGGDRNRLFLLWRGFLSRGSVYIPLGKLVGIAGPFSFAYRHESIFAQDKMLKRLVEIQTDPVPMELHSKPLYYTNNQTGAKDRAAKQKQKQRRQVTKTTMISNDRRKFLRGVGGVAGLTLAANFGYGSSVKTNNCIVSNLPGKWDAEADIVTIGGGIAGLCLSVTAAQKGLGVVLLEKSPTVGGDALFSAQAMIGVWPAGSARNGYTDTIQSYVRDLVNSHRHSMKGKMGLPAGSTDVLQFYAENVGPAFEWMESLGQVWVQGQVPYGAFPNPQWQTNYRGWGATKGIIPPLYEAAKKLGVQIRTHTSAQELIQNAEGRVVGVYAMTDDGQKLAIKGRRGVALTTGSFAHNTALIARFIPAYSKSLAIGCPYSDGSGLLMAQTVGAKLEDMGLGCHGFVLDAMSHANNWGMFINRLMFKPVTKPIPPGNDLLPHPPITGILINYDGNRFTDESSGYAIPARHIAVQRYSRGIYLWDKRDDNFDFHKGNFQKTRVYVADDISTLARQLLIDPAALQDTVNRYNGFVDSGIDTDFGKTMKDTHRIDMPPYSAVELEAMPYSTYGGLSINSSCQVMSSNDTPIPGLYAAGVVTGVPFEKAGYYYEGGLGQGTVYGRHAASMLARELPWNG
jgi:fumarate reductase flavoprotein subunit